MIVGAGPAGAQLAVRLARAGFEVVLLDRKRFPRRKPCGEFLSPECLPMLAEFGWLDPLARLGAREVRGMDLHGYGVTARGSYGPIGTARAPFDHGLAVRREVLDELAVRTASRTSGVRVVEGARVEELLRDADGAVVGVTGRDGSGAPFTIPARFTIGADGIRSRVAGRLDLRRPSPWLAKFAFVLRWHGRFDEDHSSVHLFDGGYFAVSAVDAETRTVNLVVDASAVPAGRTALPAFVSCALDRAPLLREQLSRARQDQEILAVGPLAGSTTAQHFAGGALVGDACGYVDPLTGEGLFFAMRGAQLLAAHLRDALHGRVSASVALHEYARARRREFGFRLLLSKGLQRGLRHPALARGVLRSFARLPGLCDLVVAFAGDYVPGRELLRPAVWRHALRARGA